MYANRVLRHFVWMNIDDVLAHVVVSGLSVKRLVIALHQNLVALFKCKKQDLVLGEQREATLRTVTMAASCKLLLSLWTNNGRMTNGFKEHVHRRNTSPEK